MRLKNIGMMGLRSLQARVLGRSTPLNVMYAATDRCTGSCSYCAIPQRRKRELSTAEARRLIDEAAAAGCQRLGFWGGEPLMRDDIGELAGRARSRGLFVTMDSNGHRLPERREVLKALDHLVLSLDGPQEMHDANRGAGSFQKTMAGLEAAAGKVPLWTITVLTRHNLAGIDFVLDAARRYGFLATFQLLHHNDALGRNLDRLLPPAAEYRAAIAKLIAEKRRGAPIASTLKYLRHILRWADYSRPTLAEAAPAVPCLAGRLYCNVDTDGTVYPCSLLVDQVPARSFLDEGFARAFAFAGGQRTCTSCIASCFNEYNRLYSLDCATIAAWLSAMARTRRARA
ncbi:MAG: radical SAM protein [Elusimicrobia bacterium]|nr:radical SAM protein [Elusimicrobiota bacterium]